MVYDVSRPEISALRSVRDALFLNYATGRDLVRVAGNYGVSRPIFGAADDALFRALTRLIAAHYKVVPTVILDILDVLFGTNVVRTGVLSEPANPTVRVLQLESTAAFPQYGYVTVGVGTPLAETAFVIRNDLVNSRLILQAGLVRPHRAGDTVESRVVDWELIEARSRQLVVRISDLAAIEPPRSPVGTGFLHALPRLKFALSSPARVGDTVLQVKLPHGYTFVNRPFIGLITSGSTEEYVDAGGVFGSTVLLNQPVTRLHRAGEVLVAPAADLGILTADLNGGETVMSGLLPGFEGGPLVVDDGLSTAYTYCISNDYFECVLGGDVRAGDTSLIIDCSRVIPATPFQLTLARGTALAETVSVTSVSGNVAILGAPVVNAHAAGTWAWRLFSDGAYGHLYLDEPISQGLGTGASIRSLFYPAGSDTLMYVPPVGGDLPDGVRTWLGPYVSDPEAHGMSNQNGVGSTPMCIDMTDPTDYRTRIVRSVLNVPFDPDTAETLPPVIYDTITWIPRAIHVADVDAFADVVPGSPYRIVVEGEGRVGRAPVYVFFVDRGRGILFVGGLIHRHLDGVVVATLVSELPVRTVDGSELFSPTCLEQLPQQPIPVLLGFGSSDAELVYVASVTPVTPARGVLAFSPPFVPDKTQRVDVAVLFGGSFVPVLAVRSDGFMAPGADAQGHSMFLAGSSLLTYLLRSILDVVRAAGVELIFVDRDDRVLEF